MENTCFCVAYYGHKTLCGSTSVKKIIDSCFVIFDVQTLVEKTDSPNQATTACSWCSCISLDPLSLNHGLHDLWLSVDGISNCSLSEVLPAFLHLIHKSTIRPTWWLPCFILGVQSPLNGFVSSIARIIPNHCVGGINRKPPWSSSPRGHSPHLRCCNGSTHGRGRNW